MDDVIYSPREATIGTSSTALVTVVFSPLQTPEVSWDKNDRDLFALTYWDKA